MIAAIFLTALAIYLACGLIFAVPFVLFGVDKIDAQAIHGSWGFRIVIIPGVTAFWPLLLRRWIKGRREFAVKAHAETRPTTTTSSR